MPTTFFSQLDSRWRITEFKGIESSKVSVAIVGEADENPVEKAVFFPNASVYLQNCE
jgi:hypothetical protein